MILADARQGQTNQAFEARAGRPVAATPAPASASAAPKPSASCSHVVAAGDTLGEISSTLFGTATRWREISALNPGLEPNSLRIGQVLKLPCSVGDGAGEGGAGAPPDRAAFLDRLRGALSRPDTSPAGPARPAAAASPSSGTAQDEDTATPEEESPLPPPPVWTAAQGEFLADVLARWGTKAGWTVIVDTTDAWRLQVAFRAEAAFDAAVAELIRGMGHDGVPPRVRLYPNQVLRLGGPL
ncbi:MAG: LysM peptidoglycan-binding domain-containing protein [Boseongicola sp. SB0665_bin_10]|nr:LysM peptidoglycan-binding domain-containing protein [Boseongicola sp. SB0665_bin_10]